MTRSAGFFFDPLSETWALTSPLSQAIFGSSLTTMADGRAILTGGQVTSSGVILKQAIIYDPSTGQWTAVASMNSRRAQSASILLNDGRILVYGGSSGGSQITYEIYDPTADTWSQFGSGLDLTNYSPQEIDGVLLIALANGKILGRNCIYDPLANSLKQSTLTSGYSVHMVGPSTLLWVENPCTIWNLQPAVTSGSLSVHAGNPIAVTGSTDAIGYTLTWTVVSGPANGTLSGTAPNWTYQPNPGFVGTDAVTYSVDDGLYGSSAPGTITIQVTDAAPVTSNLTVNYHLNTMCTGNLPGTDADGDPLTWSATSGPAKGTFIITNASTGAFQYTMQPGIFSNQAVHFSVTDGFLTSTGILTHCICRTALR